jgi:hypothetical protein
MHQEKSGNPGAKHKTNLFIFNVPVKFQWKLVWQV